MIKIASIQELLSWRGRDIEVELLSPSFILEQERRLWPSDFQQEANSDTHTRQEVWTCSERNVPCFTSCPGATWNASDLHFSSWNQCSKEKFHKLEGRIPAQWCPAFLLLQMGLEEESLWNCGCLDRAGQEAGRKDSVTQQSTAAMPSQKGFHKWPYILWLVCKLNTRRKAKGIF